MARLALALLLATAAPAPAQRTGGQPALPVVTLKTGETTVRAEIARTRQEQAAGLMHVTVLPDNDGMLFPYDPPRQVAFWMRNTVIPLTIAYLDRDGKILELHDMKPRDETSVPSATAMVSFVLEMNQHWFKMNSLKVGDVLTPVGTTWEKIATGDMP